MKHYLPSLHRHRDRGKQWAGMDFDGFTLSELRRRVRREDRDQADQGNERDDDGQDDKGAV